MKSYCMKRLTSKYFLTMKNRNDRYFVYEMNTDKKRKKNIQFNREFVMSLQIKYNTRPVTKLLPLEKV